MITRSLQIKKLHPQYSPPASLVQDLLNWRQIQEDDRKAAGERYLNRGMIVTNPLGGYIEPRTFSDYYHQILDMAGLQHFTFHALRHTFASRALEQGMDEKTLSVLLGHYSVAFTLDTYAHVLTDHKWEGISLMEELYSIHQVVPQNLVYPAVVTHGQNGYQFFAPDFPEINFISPSVEEGAGTITQALKDAVVAIQFPPIATPIIGIPLNPGQFVLQIPL